MLDLAFTSCPVPSAFPLHWHLLCKGGQMAPSYNKQTLSEETCFSRLYTERHIFCTYFLPSMTGSHCSAETLLLQMLGICLSTVNSSGMFFWDVFVCVHLALIGHRFLPEVLLSSASGHHPSASHSPQPVSSVSSGVTFPCQHPSFGLLEVCSLPRSSLCIWPGWLILAVAFSCHLAVC